MTALGRMAGFVTRRPRLVAGIWIVAVAVLALQGRNLDRELQLHPLFIEGTASKRAHDIAVREFGDEYAMVVMLRGPRDAVERQGRELTERLAARPRMLVVSPWTRGATVEGLRPAPGVAALVVRVEPDSEGIVGLLPPVERQLDATVSDPVRASVAGFPPIIDSLRDASEHATGVGELIAVPVLLLVLLLVFRSVLAALIPVIVGGAVVAATRGVLSLLLGMVEIDLFAIGVVGMMGLALGVDYSLLVVSRFREQEGGDAAEAARQTVKATARSIIPAGCGLLFAMLVAILLMPGAIGRSVALAVMTVTVLSMVSAIVVVPALLTLLGDNLDRWSLPKRDASQAATPRWSRRLSARPRAVVATLILMFCLAGWAFTLDSGVASVELLPTGNSGRVQQEEVEQALGPGWLAPIEVIVEGRGSPVTSPKRLRAFAAFQRRVERDPGVQAVAGLAEIERRARRLAGIERGLAEQARGLRRLDAGIARVHGGAKLNTKGLLAAAEGARALTSGVGAVNGGAGLLARSLREASAGSATLSEGLGQANDGGERVARGTAKASSGAGRLADGLERAQEQAGEMRGSARLFRNAMRSGDDRLAELHAPLESTADQLGAAWAALERMTTGRSDPEYAAAAAAVAAASERLTGKDVRTGELVDPAYEGVETGVERARGQFSVGLYLAARLDKSGREAEEGIGKLARGATRLDRGLRRLAAGSGDLAEGITELSRGGERLAPGMERLSEGAEGLAAGLIQLETGSGRLAGGLGGGAQKSKLLAGALHRIGQGLERQQESEDGAAQLDLLRRQSPGLFRSGYFVLAGLDGSQPDRREQLGSLINLDRGGGDARLLVIPRDGPASPATDETRGRIEAEASDLAEQAGAEVVVGGIAPSAIDVNEALQDQAPWMRLALSLVSFLVLVPVTRSLTLPLLAALLNLLTVSAAFGLLALLFNDSLLGGPGFVDATVIPATMIVMFGLAIDYEVFVFARMREEYVRTGSPSAAIANGLGHTAHVVSGAAAIMIAVFLAFSVSTFTTIRNFGVAQAIGVFIDAFVIRLFIIPALMSRLGRWSWWMPGWLDRLLPGGGAAAATVRR